MKVVLTGGGTAGHVMPHLAILDTLLSNGFEVVYIGSKGIEKELASKAGICFYEVSTGKLRRYFSVENALDVFRLIKGFFQCLLLMIKLKPDVVFSKGGFVAVPVTFAAWFFRIPVVTHESDYSPGLANKLIAPFSNKILYTFSETGKYLPEAKAIHVGTPVRPELFSGDAIKGKEFCGFKDHKPILLVMGGSQGAQRINDALKGALPQILSKYHVVHLTGKGKSIGFKGDGYRDFEFVGPELKDLFAASDFVISRAGANSIFELLALKKPMLLIPLEVGSRGDQILNAKSFVASGWARSLSEKNLNESTLLLAIDELGFNAQDMIAKQKKAGISDVPQKIVEILKSTVR